jgi:hypothetical protein
VNSVRQRIADLEQRVGSAESACPVCGADWPGSVWVERQPDGREVPRCFPCGAERAMPESGHVHVMPAWMWECL